MEPSPTRACAAHDAEHGSYPAELLGRWFVQEGYITPKASPRLNPLTRVGDVSPKDLHVLAVALESGSEFIATSNGKDYPDHCGVVIVPPSQFLMLLATH